MGSALTDQNVSSVNEHAWGESVKSNEGSGCGQGGGGVNLKTQRTLTRAPLGSLGTLPRLRLPFQTKME